MLKLKTMIVAGGVAAAAAAGMAIGTPALADPPSGTTPAATDIVGVGSDTTQGVNDQFSIDYNASHPAPKLYSFDAVPAGNITEKAGCAARVRPNGSGAGITELEANLRPSGNATHYCVDFARSSRARDTTVDPSSIVFVEYALDAVTWSANKTTNAAADLSTTELKAIYSCDASILGTGKTGPVTWNEVGGKGTNAVVPVIPQSASGTRKFFLASIGVTTLGSCVLGQDNTVEENEGTNAVFAGANSRNVIFPYSIAVYLAQSQGGHGAGTQGNLILKNVNGQKPATGKKGKLKINPNFPYQRKVYSVLRNGSTTGQSVPAYLQGVFGTGTVNTGYICTDKQAKADIASYGFGVDPSCGKLS